MWQGTVPTLHHLPCSALDGWLPGLLSHAEGSLGPPAQLGHLPLRDPRALSHSYPGTVTCLT